MAMEYPQGTGSKGSFQAYKREQASISRGRLYPVTIFYSAYAAVVMTFGLMSHNRIRAMAFWTAGIPTWTFIEYFVHRFLLHGRFKVSKKPHKRLITRFANRRFDPLHWEHHARPFDGFHISGQLRDILPLFIPSAIVSFLIFPAFTGSALLAGVVQCYVIEEWVHHSVHFYNFRTPYFRYIRKHHLYHHTSSGMAKGFGFTSGIWDIILNTRFPAHVRQRLYGKRKNPTPEVVRQT